MSLQTKKGLDAIWPIKGKTFLVRVDFNVPIKNGVIQNDYRIRTTLPTIRKIVDQQGICILMSHMGRPTGVAMRDDTSNAHHADLMRTWVAEKGKGKTVFFAVLPSEDKVWLLKQVPKDTFPKKWNGEIPLESGRGKTRFFAGLSEDLKTELLNKWTAKQKKNSNDFVFLRKYHGYEEENTLEPVAVKLGELLGKKVQFASDCLNAHSQVDSLQNGDVLLLENVRFYKNENSKKEEERMQMARVLAEYGDYFVSDAFGTAHRDAATITGIPKVLGHGVAGYLMKKEIDSFTAALTNPDRPMAAIVGGSKVSDKIKVLENLLKQVNKLFIGGAMAYVFLKVKGFNIGKSFCETGQSFTDKYGEEKDPIAELALNLIKKCEEAGVDLYLPIDHVTHTEFKATDKPNITPDENIPSDHMALDIGPKTRDLYVKGIAQCQTIVWNGPMGVFEIPTFAQGTFDVAKALAENKGMTIIGGGDSASAAEQSGYASSIKHISTGGGASLELLEGKELPGISVLDNAPLERSLSIKELDLGVPTLASLNGSIRSLQQQVTDLNGQLRDQQNKKPPVPAVPAAGFDLARDLPSAILTASLVLGVLFVHK